MELGNAFRLLESRLPPGDKEAREAFDHVRLKIMTAASLDNVAALENRVENLNATVLGNFNQVGEVFRLLAIYLETGTPESRTALAKFLREGK